MGCTQIYSLDLHFPVIYMCVYYGILSYKHITNARKDNVQATYGTTVENSTPVSSAVILHEIEKLNMNSTHVSISRNSFTLLLLLHKKMV